MILNVAIQENKEEVAVTSRNSFQRCPQDKRGKHPPANAISAAMKALIIRHVESFPVKESNYSSRSFKYLDEKLNIIILHYVYGKVS